LMEELVIGCKWL